MRVSRASLKRTIAAAGFDRGEVELRGVTYDECDRAAGRYRSVLPTWT